MDNVQIKNCHFITLETHRLQLSCKNLKLSGDINDLLVKNIDLAKVVRLVLQTLDEIKFLMTYGKKLKGLRYCKIDFQTSHHLQEFLDMGIERMFPSSVKLDKLEIWFNRLNVTVPTPLSNILRTCSSKKTVYKFPFSIDNQQIDFDLDLQGLEHKKIKFRIPSETKSQASVEFEKNFSCTSVLDVDDPDLGKGALEITITEMTAKRAPKILKILLTKSQADRRAERIRNP